MTFGPDRGRGCCRSISRQPLTPHRPWTRCFGSSGLSTGHLGARHCHPERYGIATCLFKLQFGPVVDPTAVMKLGPRQNDGFALAPMRELAEASRIAGIGGADVEVPEIT